MSVRWAPLWLSGPRGPVPQALGEGLGDKGGLWHILEVGGRRGDAEGPTQA